ncbi:hypothetical protein A2533_03340 [Candidatus Falkowbacteria bacterium RIFOXYD2_FULL_35_9]|uniref:Uncharacterized protein n=1 Tax=Candidatus Falkowbacteria bacterium RIFOXYC2_FULL_36_12 TaxID=1798002 RepID=A0A1F5SW26_9BACT|nr:MAG: hypothetical protein A2478_00620 [Candidatus Falkowbacteria bacterium RIFOXYC2_FULL_36_12]OGF47349.1 MAG: hypothetical protein A2533_03340 [Candidatus Falkowbacteria bacterium RIFOXYD2_FULL_35_9]
MTSEYVGGAHCRPRPAFIKITAGKPRGSSGSWGLKLVIDFAKASSFEITGLIMCRIPTGSRDVHVRCFKYVVKFDKIKIKYYTKIAVIE